MDQNVSASERSAQTAILLSVGVLMISAFSAGLAAAAERRVPEAHGRMFPLSAVRLLDSPFATAVAANRAYLLALEPDRLLAPFLREAGLEPKKPPYPNWESQGLDGHTAGHYLSALADMIASGNDADDELGRRLDHMLSELERVQSANGNGYIGGIPGSRDLWKAVASGNVGAIRSKWVPWYNVHKTFAGLRDAYTAAGRSKARELLIKLGDWCVDVTSRLTDEQMQRMLGTEYGGMNEVLADLHTITGDPKYLRAAERFNHRAISEPLVRGEDKLTGLHANTQIPKIIGLEEIATLTSDPKQDGGARFFWDTVVNRRSVAFGGNSVSEHFNDPADFRPMLEDRQGPETCNTYNMLRLTEKLFAGKPDARYADFYERALFNHVLSTIDPDDPGYVYFTPIRPRHYRVYSKPDQSFWCCVGTGMENPGRYGQFIYARDKDDLYVNLFIASELNATDGVSLRQENRFPFEAQTRLTLKLDRPRSFGLHLRHPWWVPEGKLGVRINGQRVQLNSTPSMYIELRREWRDADRVDVDLPMHTTVERLPDGSDWVAILHGPIVLASPAGTQDLVGERADAGRMSHVASGPMVPMDEAPFLMTTPADLPKHVVPDPEAGPLHFRIIDVAEPKAPQGLALQPFFSLHHARYQMYWEVVSREGLERRRERIAARERALIAREAATLDRVAPGEQQSEVEHEFKSDNSDTGLVEGRRWRGGGRSLAYALDARGEKEAELEVTFWGSDRARTFTVVVEGQVIGTETPNRDRPRRFYSKRYQIPADVLARIAGRRLAVQFLAQDGEVGRIFDLRLMKPGAPEPPASN